jgi:uncharacterized protein YndB with AHSA1/START domain
MTAMQVSEIVRSGWGVVFEMAETMPGPPEIVWELITDFEHQSDWMIEASDLTVLTDHRQGVGVEAEATSRIGGIKTRDKVRVSGWDPPRKLTIEHRGWVTGTGEIFLTPLNGDRTHMFWREELHPPIGILGAFGLTAFRPMMGRIFQRDLRVLAGLVRARSKASG